MVLLLLIGQLVHHLGLVLMVGRFHSLPPANKVPDSLLWKDNTKIHISYFATRVFSIFISWPSLNSFQYFPFDSIDRLYCGIHPALKVWSHITRVSIGNSMVVGLCCAPTLCSFLLVRW
mmetsp:Transcript_67737/g.75814  ORF Transcript_67737/g.75814 Transcript_67737/m.75814 type:complete len:119 (+) Transcript_67737:377-733(+)